MVADVYITNMKARYEDKKIVFRYFEKLGIFRKELLVYILENKFNSQRI